MRTIVHYDWRVVGALCAEVAKLAPKEALSADRSASLQRAHNVANSAVMKRDDAPSVCAAHTRHVDICRGVLDIWPFLPAWCA